MKNETTPTIITPKIKEYCKDISDVTPLYVYVHPAPGMEFNNCFPNVSSLVKQIGGKQVNGWAIWQFANVYIYFEAHAVWQNDVGCLIDPTPHIDGESRILFLPDSKVKYQGQKIPGIRKPLTESSLAKEYIELLSELECFIINNFNFGKITQDNPAFLRLSYIHKRSIELSDTFKSKVGRNELCPCGSGLKYKKCCGQYNYN